MRQAQEEAAAELATYRAQREEAFKKLVASVSVLPRHVLAPRPRARPLTRCRPAQQTGDAGATMKQLEADSVQLNGSMAQNVASSKAAVRSVCAAAPACSARAHFGSPQVVDMLVGFATTV